MGYPVMHGYLEDAIANQMSNALFGQDQKVIDPNLPEAKARAEFYANVLSLTGEKFVESPQGKKAITNAAVYPFVMGLAAGALLGWWFSRRKA